MEENRRTMDDNKNTFKLNLTITNQTEHGTIVVKITKLDCGQAKTGQWSTYQKGRELDRPPDEAYGGPNPLSGGDTTWTMDQTTVAKCGEVPNLS